MDIGLQNSYSNPQLEKRPKLFFQELAGSSVEGFGQFSVFRCVQAAVVTVGFGLLKGNGIVVIPSAGVDTLARRR